MGFKLKSGFIVLIIIFQIKPDFLYSGVNRNIPEEYSANNTLGFVRNLISKDEYYRALVELKRLDSYYPGYVKKDKIFITELFLLFKGEQYSEILSGSFHSEDFNTQAIVSIFKTDSLTQKPEFVNTKELIDSAGFKGISRDIDFYLYKRMLLSYMLLNKIEETRKIIENRAESFNNIGLNSAGFTEITDQAAGCFESLKNPHKAVFLGIMPGMGYVYADRPSTGIIAFVLISVLSAATYYSFKTDNKPAGIFIGAAAGFFYGGSIIGGYLAAKRYNSAAINGLQSSLSQKLELSLDREKIYNEWGIGHAGE